MTTALDGLRVIELTRGMAGAMAGMVLADNGADVITVAAPGVDRRAQGPGFVVWDRGKRSIALDLRTEDGRARFLDLVDTADGLIDDLRPGAAERLGVDHAVLGRRNPGLVYAKVTGFGERGPKRDLPGWEHVVAAVSGRMASQAGVRPGPTFTPAPIATYGAAMLAVQGLLAGLLARERTGRGRRVHTSLLHSLVAFDMTSGYGHRIHQEDTSGRVYGVMPLAFMTAECKDGRYIQMCSRLPHLFRNWMRVLGLEHLCDEPALKDMPDVLPSQEALDDVVAQVRERMKERTFDEWLDVFSQQDVGGNPFLSASEFLETEQARVTGRVVEIDDPVVGPTVQIGPLAVLSGTPSRIGAPAPLAGAHTDEVLSSLAATPRRPGPAPAAAAAASLVHPLDGITVLEAGYAYAAPFSMTLLAEMGARVIKLEGPEGDIARRNWITDYAKETPNKESVVVDLKTAAGRDIAQALAARADLFVHNFRPGVPERLGIGYEALSAINDRLIYLYGSCYGSTGPWAHLPGFHSSPNAIAGVGMLECGAGNAPQNRTYGDPTGALALAAAALVALHARERTGKGQYVETTMLASLASVISGWSVTYRGKPADPIPDAEQLGFDARCRLYETADGWLFLQAPGKREWQALLDVLAARGMPLNGHLAAGRAGDELAGALAERFARRPADDWEEDLVRVGVGGVRADLTSFADFMLNEPHMRINRLSILDELPGVGPFWRSSGCVEFSDLATREETPEPLGASTDRVLRELGRAEAEMEALRSQGVTRAVGDGLPRGH